ncbi:MAG: hypothetical protein A2Z72_05520 [Omnitrophica bacterium RBG_13_46_9]|nr:MAG: hypothetical protein A2Z72_05520 [Omnitrophica bacterium RBG_13_46_9]
MSKNEIKNSFIDYSALVGSNVGVILISFVSIPLLVRILGVADYGRLNLFFMVCQVAAVVVTRWTSMAMVRFGKEEFVKWHRISETFWARSAISFPVYAVIAAALFVFRGKITGYIGINDIWSVWLIVLFIGFFWFIDCGHNISKATGRMRLYATMELLERVILTGLLALVFFTSIRAGLTLVITFYCLCQFLVALYFLCRNKTDIFYPVKIHRHLVIDIFRYSAPLFVVSASAMAMGWIDVFVIKIFSSAESVGLYSLSYRLMSYLELLSTHAATVILPILISFHVAKNDNLIKEYVKRFIPQMAFLWSFLISLLMVTMHFSFDFIFGKDFAPSLQVLSILLLGLSSYVLFSLHRPIIHVYKLTGKVFFITAFALAINTLLDFMFVPAFGIKGAAVATSISIVAMTLMQFRVTGGYLKIINLKQFLPLSIAFFTFFIVLFSKKTFTSGAVSIFAILLFSWILLKTGRFFAKSDMDLLEKIDMPLALKSFLKRAITVLA